MWLQMLMLDRFIPKMGYDCQYHTKQIAGYLLNVVQQRDNFI